MRAASLHQRTEARARKSQVLKSKSVKRLGSNIKKQVEDIISKDNKRKFVTFIERSLLGIADGCGEEGICPSELLMSVCSHSAVKCAAVLLEQVKTGSLEVDLNAPFKTNGLYPIHYAVKCLSLGVTKLLLDNGAKTDVRCSDDHPEHPGMLPFGLALEATCKNEFVLEWSPRKSVYKLIYILCVPELRESLGILKLLAANTEDLQVICARMLREGRLCEFGILLMVARDKLLTAPAGANVPFIRRVIMEEQQLIVDEEFKSMGRSCPKESRMLRDRKNLIQSAQLMLDIFAKAGVVLDRYRCSKRTEERPKAFLAVDVAFLLKVSGFDLKKKDETIDDLYCFVPKLSSEKAEALRRTLDMMPNPHPSMPHVRRNFSTFRNTCPWTRRDEHHRMMSEKLLGGGSSSVISQTTKTGNNHVKKLLVEPALSSSCSSWFKATTGWTSFYLPLLRKIRFV